MTLADEENNSIPTDDVNRGAIAKKLIQKSRTKIKNLFTLSGTGY